MKKTFADKVKHELQRQHGLGAIVRQFNRWKYLAKKSPDKYRIYRSGSKFWLEEYKWCHTFSGNNAWQWVKLDESIRGNKTWISEWI